MQGLRLKPRLSPLVLPLVAVGLTVVAAGVGAATGALEKLLPFTTLPILAAVGYSVVSRTPRVVTLELRDGWLHLEGYERQAVALKPTKVALERWVHPVLGTRQGDALVVRGPGPDGREIVLRFATAGGTSSRAVDPPCEQADVSLGGAEFLQLSSLCPTTPSARESGTERASTSDIASTFALVPHRGAGAAFGQMLPWFGTMVVVCILGVLGQPLLQTMLGRVVLFGVIFAAIGAGVFHTFRRAKKPKRESLLRISGTSVSMGDQRAPTFQARLADVEPSSEIYVYSTKYGTFRFPVLVLSSATQQLRIGVWEEYTTVGVALAPEGAAPEYLVSADDYRAIVRLLGR